ncbi:RrF2 family transcriptional regulator [Iningainema tapete]|uniref:Rrf2 family transcriptional regulator n=1 Tax=Iningainema tapete BLCC-T55 TaxID=2748662 RepID=A0A8J6XQS6_9CYAN|nr:Rrf2 family transcriptional regulator [Iningainema tapete]MBD2774832.1 Rrf2 family transcriptional regulator [Iningainema tapete BLCC-T55]
MELSNKFEYAMLAMLELAKHYSDGESLHIKEIAALQNIPNRYLEQILATLRIRGLIKSVRGAKGGYVLAQQPQKITVLDVFNCMEGADAVKKESTPKTVDIEVIEEVWQQAHQAASLVLQECTLQDLCEQLAIRQKIDIMYYI